jgi:uracil-DNA glycosylase family 4
MTNLAGLRHINRQIISCGRCPRLRAYCARVAADRKAAYRHETYWGRPVPGFGDPQARMLIVGLAPAAHGANRTGRMFTGDSSGDFLTRALHRAGLANRSTSRHRDDGLVLTGVYVGAAARCAPPANRPTPEELDNCRPYLAAEVAALSQVAVIVALGRIAFDAVLRALGDDGAPVRPKPPFEHGRLYRFGRGRPVVVASYHPSRQNTNTGRLTARMFDDVFRRARRLTRPKPRS